MAYEIKVPRLGWTMEEGTFVEWLKKDGDHIAEGDPLFALESDKATQEVESIDSGILRISPDGPEDGDTVSVGDIVGYLVAEGEKAPFQMGAGSVTKQATEPIDVPEPATIAPDPTIRSKPTVRHAVPRSGRGKTISPRAARLATELRVNWRPLRGSGRTGRIRSCDILAAAEHQRTTGPEAKKSSLATGERIVELSSVRRTIARKMALSAQNTVPVTLTRIADATELSRVRSAMGAQVDSSKKSPSYFDILLKLVAFALERHPTLNRRWEQSQLIESAGIHIGIAVDTEAGLMVPVLRDVQSLDVTKIAALGRDLVDRARSGTLRREEMEGGTFTMTNLGAYGIDAFSPVINDPQVAILGIGRIAAQPIVSDDGNVTARQSVTLSLTFDHRALDGAPAARFLDDLSKLLRDLPKTL